MGKLRIDEIDVGSQKMGVSRWHIAYMLALFAVPFATYDASLIYRYWPAITSTFWELYQCVAGSR